MNILITYDSKFGNTKKIAEHISKTFTKKDTVNLIHVNDFKQDMLDNLDILIVGTPTHGFRPSENTQKFLNTISSLNGTKVIAFDTRIHPEDVKSGILRFMIKTFGYAAKPLSKELEKKNGKLILEPEGFYVKDQEGPIKDGEMDRVKEWIKEINN